MIFQRFQCKSDAPIYRRKRNHNEGKAKTEKSVKNDTCSNEQYFPVIGSGKYIPIQKKDDNKKNKKLKGRKKHRFLSVDGYGSIDGEFAIFRWISPARSGGINVNQ